MYQRCRLRLCEQKPCWAMNSRWSMRLHLSSSPPVLYLFLFLFLFLLLSLSLSLSLSLVLLSLFKHTCIYLSSLILSCVKDPSQSDASLSHSAGALGRNRHVNQGNRALVEVPAAMRQAIHPGQVPRGFLARALLHVLILWWSLCVYVGPSFLGHRTLLGNTHSHFRPILST